MLFIFNAFLLVYTYMCVWGHHYWSHNPCSRKHMQGKNSTIHNIVWSEHRALTRACNAQYPACYGESLLNQSLFTSIPIFLTILLVVWSANSDVTVTCSSAFHYPARVARAGQSDWCWCLYKYIYLYVSGKKIESYFSIDSPLQTFAVGLLDEFID